MENNTVAQEAASTYLKFTGHKCQCCRVQVGGCQHLIELHLSLLHRCVQRLQLTLQQQVLEACLLLYLLDGISEPPVQLVPLLLDLGAERPR